MSAQSKRRWRQDPANRRHENELRTMRARLTSNQRLRESIRDTLRHIENRLKETA